MAGFLVEIKIINPNTPLLEDGLTHRSKRTMGTLTMTKGQVFDVLFKRLRGDTTRLQEIANLALSTAQCGIEHTLPQIANQVQQQCQRLQLGRGEPQTR